MMYRTKEEKVIKMFLRKEEFKFIGNISRFVFNYVFKNYYGLLHVDDVFDEIFKGNYFFLR